MIDFKELDKAGIRFELLIREIFIKLNYDVKWSGVGPDRGKDLLVTEVNDNIIARSRRKWLVQCKHNAHGEGSVGLENIGDFVSACHDHNVTNYLLVCSTQPSSALMERFESVAVSRNLNITYWDATRLEKMLSSIELYDIFQMFFPISADAANIKIFATPQPNEWIFIYKGYYIILENRIISEPLVWSHEETREIIDELDEVRKKHLTKYELLVPRKIWYNGKSPEFVWYIDYLYDTYHIKEQPTLSGSDLKKLMEDGYVGSNGQVYIFEFRFVPASFSSDHFHENHLEYYDMVSKIRGKDFSFNKKIYQGVFKDLQVKVDQYLDEIHQSLSVEGKVRVLKCVPDNTKALFNFPENASWEDFFGAESINSLDEFFGPRLIMAVDDEDWLINLLSQISIKTIEHSMAFFELKKRYVYGKVIEKDDFTHDL